VGPKLSPQPCQEKHRLANQIRTTMNEILMLQARQMEAAAAGNFRISEYLKQRIRHSRERKDSMLELYKDHVSRHSC